MPSWVGFLGSWALLVLALGLAAFAIAGETINIRDIRRLNRAAMIDELIAEKTGSKAGSLRQAPPPPPAVGHATQHKGPTGAKQTDALPCTAQTHYLSAADKEHYA